MSVASSTVASPTPPAAPSTSTVSSSCTSATVRNAWIAVRVRDAERGGVAQVDRVGHDGHRRRVHDDPLRVRADEARRRRPGRRRQPSSTPSPSALDDTRELAPRHERCRELHLVLVGDDEHVGEVHRRVGDVDEHLTGAGDGIRDLLDHDRLRRAVLEHSGGAHG